MAQAGVHLYCDWFGTSTDSDLGHVAPDRYDYARIRPLFRGDPRRRPGGLLHAAHRRDRPAMVAGGPSRGDVPVRGRQARADFVRLAAMAAGDGRRPAPPDRLSAPGALRRSHPGLHVLQRLHGRVADVGHVAGVARRLQPAGPAGVPRVPRAAVRRPTTALRAAWNDPQVTLATAAHARRGRNAARAGRRCSAIRSTERQAIDFYEFISNMDADALAVLRPNRRARRPRARRWWAPTTPI